MLLTLIITVRWLILIIVIQTAQDEKSVDSDTEDKPDVVEDVDPTSGTISTSDPLGESTNVATETKPDDVTIEVVETDKVVKHEAVEEIVTTESKQETENNGMKYGDIIVYDVSDDDVTPEMETEKEAASSKVNFNHYPNLTVYLELDCLERQ